MRRIRFIGSIDEHIKITPFSIISRQLVERVTVVAVPYETRSLYVGLAVKAISESSIENVSDSDYDNVASGGARGKILSLTERLRKGKVRVVAVYTIYGRLVL